MHDPTEKTRTRMVAESNAAVKSMDEDKERVRLEKIHGKVYDTSEAGKDFEFIGFLAPFAMVRERSTGKKGMLQFQHRPRFYFNFLPE